MAEHLEFLGDRYRILEVRRGGMGEVIICELVEDPAPDAAQREGSDPLRLALKTFQRRFFFDSATRHSFVREATTWLRLSDLPHIMPVAGIEHIDHRPFVVMPAVQPGPGGERSIADLLLRGPLDTESALEYAFQLAVALLGAAARIPRLVHGDLKPENVLLMDEVAFLSDFGLVSAISLGHPDLRLEGTWAYRAPELWADEAQAPSVAGDVYAFGVLLFEMLTGSRPFSEKEYDREAWATAHRSRRPVAPSGYPAEGLPAAGMALALDCLEKKPSRRPRNFAEVLDRVNTVLEEHDPVSHRRRVMLSAVLSQGLGEQGAKSQDLAYLRTHSLLKMGEPQQALEELDAFPRDEYDARLWLYRGSALSYLERDEEALDCFERALAGELSPQERMGCLSEYALSLKRLGRFDEARALYKQLMASVSDDQLPMVMVNLASVYLEQEQGEEVVRLLEPFVRKEPDVAIAWVSLARAYVIVGKYGKAESAYGRALGLAPQDGRTRVWLAALYMDHLDRLEHAWEALDAAFGSGYESREWFVRMLACSLLLDKRDAVGDLLHALQEDFPEHLAQAIVDDSHTMAQELARRYSNQGKEYTADD
jgi:serine/threonine protein kinase/Flp pilus assembly protein TadD